MTLINKFKDVIEVKKLIIITSAKLITSFDEYKNYENLK